ncbi:MAG: class I SAM-dependent methyltransferase [gamma proteobacterium endosymbiont of Lamellibrachia anaximandri]|nr:class I SAM-dependent methyltransferase [gamma proteobacterium endosymbiont of Lamellibrachia anaximandri]MBL3532327.1 class I SAM-dependent methyltransferase [gamma proteobacterium endosymbiont of Lamellibrachia anaximandri]
MLHTYINETRVALRLIEGTLEKDKQALEVGAGLCLFSLFLKQQGYQITALEPGAGGFDAFTIAKRVILDLYHSIPLPIIERPAQALNPAKDGQFDLIFSNNVVEHIPGFEQALAALNRCLVEDGIMIHGCPNYFVPYEPHLQIPVIKNWPTLSERVFRHQVEAKRAIWESLNFISYFDVKRFAEMGGLQISFRQGLLYQAFKRLDEDEAFRRRQAGSAIASIYRLLKITGLIYLIKRLPAALATPMVFELRKNGR